MLVETLYLVCANCGAWIWDLRVFDFPRARIACNPRGWEWKIKHLECAGRPEMMFADRCFEHVAESDQKVFGLDPEKYDADFSPEGLECTGSLKGGK